MWGIQVNVGTRLEPNWRWMYDYDMSRIEFPSEAQAQVQMEHHWWCHKAGCFRVTNTDEE